MARMNLQQLQHRWPRNVVLWVAVGGVLGATQCQWARPARSAAAAAPILWDGPLPMPPDLEPGIVEHVPHRSPIRHVVGI